MKRYFYFFVLAAVVIGLFSFEVYRNGDVSSVAKKQTAVDVNFHNGDLIFQSSNSGQSAAVQLATHSVYTHCGILFSENGKWMVYEAVQPVRKVPVEQWTAAGQNGFYIVRRLKNADSLLNESKINAMKTAAIKRLGRDYDIYFSWDEERLYCSELVWKVYEEGAGIEVGTRKKMRDYDLTAPAVKKIMRQRYGNKPPLDEFMISPQDVFESDKLITVKEIGKL
ncbi:MAG: YiiX family permuted papain-like enzyme [Bacteroidia bacterium]